MLKVTCKGCGDVTPIRDLISCRDCSIIYCELCYVHHNCKLEMVEVAC